MTYWVTDRKEDSANAQILDCADIKNWQYALWQECLIFALGEVVAVFHTKKQANEICHMLNAADSLKKVLDNGDYCLMQRKSLEEVKHD